MKDKEKTKKQLLQELSELHQQVIKLTSQRLESIGFLAGGIAHDFNNLLAVIMGNISLVKVLLNSNEKAFQWLTMAEKASEKAKMLIQQILSFSEVGEPFRKAVFLKRLIIYATRFVIEGSKVKCRFFIDKDLSMAMVDERQIRQVINIIVTNANEAIASKGVITVRAENIFVTEDVLSSSLSSGDYIRISIEDTGRGIPEEVLPKIFDPYFTTKNMCSQNGMGLGLSICHSIIKKHGGCITVESVVGVGTTFYIYLPAYKTKT
jgi:signal transduction histidine kinase